MSLIHTCELNHVKPLDYLTELQRHAEALKKTPSDSMPCNFRETRARTGALLDVAEGMPNLHGRKGSTAAIVARCYRMSERLASLNGKSA